MFFVVCVQATIHIADPLQLSACSLVSAHGYSPIVGLDVLSPGSENIVVCANISDESVEGRIHDLC